MVPVVNEKALEELKQKESKILSNLVAADLLKQAALNIIKRSNQMVYVRNFSS